MSTDEGSAVLLHRSIGHSRHAHQEGEVELCLPLNIRVCTEIGRTGNPVSEAVDSMLTKASK